MRGEAMKLTCDRLEQMGEPLGEYRALEFFARAGDWQTTVYASKVKSLSAWEIAPDYEMDLKRNLPGAEIRIEDSYKLAQEKCYQNAFEFIVFDNPQSVFGDYCEHFEALPLLLQLMAKQGLVIFNINRRPFNYEQSPAWQKQRMEYYGCDASTLDAGFFLAFYACKFAAMGLKVRFSFEEQRNKEYLSYLVFGLERS
jgi:hypothetical protein